MKIKISLITSIFITAGYSQAFIPTNPPSYKETADVDGVCIVWGKKFMGGYFTFQCYPNIDEFDCLIRGLPEDVSPVSPKSYNTRWLSSMNSCEDFCSRISKNSAGTVLRSDTQCSVFVDEGNRTRD